MRTPFEVGADASLVAPTTVLWNVPGEGHHPISDAIEQSLEGARRVIHIVEIDRVRRDGGDMHRRADGRTGFDHPVVEQVAKYGTDGADRQWRAHGAPPFAPSR